MINFKKWFAKKKPTVDDAYDYEYHRDLDLTFKTLPYWTPELIEWIGRENNPVILAATAHLVNCHEWPDYLPSKPDNYEDIRDGDKLYFCVDVYKMLKEKSNAISPQLERKVWLTNYFRKYSTKTPK